MVIVLNLLDKKLIKQLEESIVFYVRGLRSCLGPELFQSAFLLLTPSRLALSTFM